MFLNIRFMIFVKCTVKGRKLTIRNKMLHRRKQQNKTKQNRNW
jgi:hypothetical protein